MSALLRLWRSLRHRRSMGQPGAPDHDALEADRTMGSGLDPTTAALSEGAPPAGAGGRIQPSGSSPDPRHPRGPSEDDVGNLPG